MKKIDARGTDLKQAHKAVKDDFSKRDLTIEYARRCIESDPELVGGRTVSTAYVICAVA